MDEVDAPGEDPANDDADAARSAIDWLSAAKQQERSGELFRAYDLALQGLKQHPEDLALKHRAILCLASTGATLQASAKFTTFGLDDLEVRGDATSSRAFMDIAALRARLIKDRALKERGERRTSGLLDAAQIYEEIYLRAKARSDSEAYYPAINAATLRLLAGDFDRAAALADATLRALDDVALEQSDYYERVSELEARLVLGDLGRAREIVRSIKTERRWTSEADYRALASTLRQLHLVLDAKDLAHDVLSELAMPRVVHFAGHIVAPPGAPGRFPADQEASVRGRIEAALDARRVGFGYGSLAAGADILFAEAMLARDVALNIVLPFDEADFIDVSVRPSGAAWVDRYWSCRNAATSVRFATTERYLGEDGLFAYCSELAMGLALLRARHLSACAEQITVWDGCSTGGTSGTAADMEIWRKTGLPQTTVACTSNVGLGSPVIATSEPADERRRTRAMIFADLRGSTRLDDEALPIFTDVVLGAFAKVVDRFGDDVLLANTWGDALFLVFDDAGKAADCALDLQEAMAAIDLAACGLPSHFALRIGAHLGPVHLRYDPILKKDNFFGAHVSRAARIEPVTPEGCVYVTEMMAAVLALHNADRFCCDYVGYTQAAKNYGALRMFLLRRQTEA